MKKFKFKMEGLYKLRKEEERQEMMAVAELKQKETRLQAKLDDLLKKRAEWVRTYNEIANEVHSGDEICLIEQYLGSIDSHRAKIESDMKALELRIAQEMVKLEKAFTARKQVETFKEKQEAIWQAEMRKQENYILDEMNNIRFIREKLNGR